MKMVVAMTMRIDNMNSILFPEDVCNVIQAFLMVNDGDEATENLILSIGAELLDVSTDTMYDMVMNWK